MGKFICPRLERVRNRELIGGLTWTGNSSDRIGNLLFDRAKIEEVKKLLGSLWRERTSLLLMAQRGGQG